MTTPALGFVLAQFDVSPLSQAEFNEWCDTEELPRRLAVPGVLGARRAQRATAPRFSTMYDVDARVAGADPGGRSAWSQRMLRTIRALDEVRYEQLVPGDETLPAEHVYTGLRFVEGDEHRAALDEHVRSVRARGEAGARLFAARGRSAYLVVYGAATRRAVDEAAASSSLGRLELHEAYRADEREAPPAATDAGVPRFYGPAGEAHGGDWCCRPAMYGPPDRVDPLVLQWLVLPGPPMSCYFVMIPPLPRTERLDHYHVHPTTWSIHVILEGSGYYHIDGKRHEFTRGSVLYHGPGVPHAGPYADPGVMMQMLVIQHPGGGHKKGEWQLVPELGLTEQPNDLAAFIAKYGDPGDRAKYPQPFPDADLGNPTARWKHYMQGIARTRVDEK